MSLLQRSVSSVGWRSGANGLKLVVFFVRTTILLRLIPDPGQWGILATALLWIQLSLTIPRFGLSGAFLHRADETRDEQQAAAVMFTLQSIFLTVWAIVLTLLALAFTSGQLRIAILFLIVTQGLSVLIVAPAQAILVRRVVHRRMALVELGNAVVNSVVAVVLAMRGFELWALLWPYAATTVSAFLFYYTFRPVWRPSFRWRPEIVRYYLRFGREVLMGDGLLALLDRVDDVFTRVFLGNTALGYYSRAYSYATYPSQLLALPLNAVAGGTYATLADNRHRLSQAFFRVNAFLVRSGFFLGGFTALIAPEFIRAVPGPAWMPILDVFRLMLFFTLLDPLKATIANLFIAVGAPRTVAITRAVQLLILVALMFILGPSLGMVGVAIAVNVMLGVGITVLLWRARRHVDYSFRRLFGPPTLALAVSLLAARAMLLIPGILGADWRTFLAKVTVYVPLYFLLLFALEGRMIADMLRVTSQNLRQKSPGVKD